MNIKQVIKDMDLKGNPANHRIVVAMSGGVDSSVTAALLVEAGFDVVGLTMQLYDHGKALKKKGACCAGSDINDARLVADKLQISEEELEEYCQPVWWRKDVIFTRSCIRSSPLQTHSALCDG